MPFTPITLTDQETYATGTPVGPDSSVEFLLTVPLIDSSTGATIPASPLTAHYDSAGHLLDPDTGNPGVVIYATTDPTTRPATTTDPTTGQLIGPTYRVRKRIAGQIRADTYISVPYDAPAGTVALGQLIGGQLTPPPVYYDLRGVTVPPPLQVTRQGGRDVISWDPALGTLTQALTRTADGAAWADATGGGGGAGFTWRGEWDYTLDYVVGDVVYEDGSAYICTVAIPAPPDPGDVVDPANDTDHWGLFVAQGEQGPTGSGFYWQGPWAVAAYGAASVVEYQGSTYLAIADTAGNNPPDTSPNWQLMAAKGDNSPFATADPLADGTADTGSGDAAHGDHVHPLSAAYATADALSTHTVLTTGAHGGIVASGDSRLTDARTPTTHAGTHVTGGGDVIANAVAGGAAGLLSGTDKTKLDSVASGAQPGTVTSVDVTVPSVLFTVSGTPITGTGTAALTLKTQNPNTVLAGPATGGAAIPTMRALVAADIPDISAVYLPVARLTGGGVLATGGNTLTVPTTGTAALVGVDNVFTAAQGVRVAASGIAAGLHAPWVTGDSLPALVGGASTAGNTQIGVSGLSDSGAGVQGQSASSVGVLGVISNSSGAAPLEGRYTGSAVGIATLLKLRNSTTGTVVAGTGGQLSLLCASDTTAGRTQAAVVSAWTDPADATRSAYLALHTSNGGTVAERLRIGPTGAVALRSTTLTNAAGLYVPWVSGDAASTVRVGSSTAGNDQTGVQAVSDSGAGVTGTSTSGAGVQGQTTTGTAGVLGLMSGAGTTALEGRYTGSGTGPITLLRLQHATSGTGGATTGGVLAFLAKTSTTTGRTQADWTASWGGSATEGSQKARMILSVYDTAAREILRGEASGTAPMIGFLGASAVVRQTLAAAATDAATVITLANSIRTALLAYGLGV